MIESSSEASAAKPAAVVLRSGMTFAFCCKSYRLADAMLAVTSVFSAVLENLRLMEPRLVRGGKRWGLRLRLASCREGRIVSRCGGLRRVWRSGRGRFAGCLCVYDVAGVGIDLRAGERPTEMSFFFSYIIHSLRVPVCPVIPACPTAPQRGHCELLAHCPSYEKRCTTCEHLQYAQTSVQKSAGRPETGRTSAVES